MTNKILAVSFVLGALAFNSANAVELKGKEVNTKIQQKVNSKKAEKDGFMKKMDKNGDGVVSKKEHKQFLKEMFNELDKNKDKVLTQDEFVIKGKKKCPFMNEEAFKNLDKNSDGRLTKKEFVKGKEKEFKNMQANKDALNSKKDVLNSKKEEMKAKKELNKNKVNSKKDKISAKNDGLKKDNKLNLKK